MIEDRVAQSKKLLAPVRLLRFTLLAHLQVTVEQYLIHTNEFSMNRERMILPLLESLFANYESEVIIACRLINSSITAVS